VSRFDGLASEENVLTPNADGNILAAHIFVTTGPANASNTALATGVYREWQCQSARTIQLGSILN
jgi:hypothetical protein